MSVFFIRCLSSCCRSQWSCVPSSSNSWQGREQPCALVSFIGCRARRLGSTLRRWKTRQRVRVRARIRRFSVFCLHLFTIWPQVVVKQWDTCEGFTLFAFTLFRVFVFSRYLHRKWLYYNELCLKCRVGNKVKASRAIHLFSVGCARIAVRWRQKTRTRWVRVRASAPTRARDGGRGKEWWGEGRKKAVEFSPNVDAFVEKVHRFFFVGRAEFDFLIGGWGSVCWNAILLRRIDRLHVEEMVTLLKFLCYLLCVRGFREQLHSCNFGFYW